MAQTTSLVFNGGSIPSPAPVPTGSGKAKLLKIGEITITEQGAQVTKKVICDPDSVTTDAPFMEVLTSAKLAELVEANSIIVLDDGDMQYLMANASITVEEGVSVCTAVNFLGLSQDKRAKVAYNCTRITDELTLQQVVEVGEPVETDFNLVIADSEDTAPNTLIDKMEVVSNEREPDEPTILQLEATVDGQGNRKVAINEDNLRTFVKEVDDAFEDVWDAIGELPNDEHGYFNSSLYTTPGDGTTTNLVMDNFRISEGRSVHGDNIEFVTTHQEGGVDFGEVYLNPGTYILNVHYTLQWVGNPRGTFLPLVTNVGEQPFDFSCEHEDILRSTRIVTKTTRGKFGLNFPFDADTPPMGIWVKYLEIAQIASYNHPAVTHDSTLAGSGQIADPLRVTPAAFGKVKDIPTSISQFRTGDVIPVDGPNGPAKMEADTLLELTAENALAGNLAPAFDPTRTEDDKYLAGESVTCDGKVYVFKVDHYGAWNNADVYQLAEEDLVEIALKKKIDAARGKNLFDKNSLNKQAGCYVAYNAGRLVTASNYSAYAIELDENIELTFNKSNVHVAAFSGKILINHERVTGQLISGYIDGINLTNAGMTWTTPAGTKCIIVSVADDNVDSLQVEKGSIVTPYESYKTGISKTDVFELSYDLTKKLNYDCGKNLLNKDTPNKRSGYYVSYNTGSLIVNANYSAIVVELGAGIELAFNQNGLHIAAFGELLDIREQFLGNIPTYIDGCTTSTENRTWTTPIGCKCIVVSCSNSGINSLQVEKGSVPTSYEPYKTGIESEKVFGLAEIKTALEKKIDAKLNGVCGKNLFNVNTSNKQAGCYVSYNTGSLIALESFSSYAIEIGAGVELAFNKNDMHVTAYSTEVDVSFASAGAIDGYISGYLTSSSNRTWTTPAGTKYIIVSCYTSFASSLQVEKGSSPTAFEPYVFGMPSSKLIGSSILVVGQGFEFSTIQSAVDVAQDGSTILIMPGVYNEAVKTVYQEKLLRLVGFDRDKCIITRPVNDYFNPPLEIAKGMVENLTFVVTGTELDNNGAYCVHIDFTQSIGQSLQFINCSFKSTIIPCVGVGLRENFTLSFVGCSFENYAKNGPIYCHEQQANNKTDQRIEVVNCSILNSATDAIRPAITLQETSSYTGNEATILLQRNIMKCKRGDYTQGHDAIWCKDHSTNDPTSGGGKYLDSHIWELDFMSEMNSASIANSSEQ